MIWEYIHRLVEMLNKTFENVSELDIMINSGLVRLLIVWIRLACNCTSCVCFLLGMDHSPRSTTLSSLHVVTQLASAAQSLAGLVGKCFAASFAHCHCLTCRHTLSWTRR
jgi:hypothetical protein